MTPEAALMTFQALKLHFTTKYDYFKYHGKTRCGDLEAKKDKWNYVRLSRQHGDHLIEYLVANFTGRPDAKWSGDFVGPEAEETYKEWQKRIESMTYIFTGEVEGVFEELRTIGLKNKYIFHPFEGNPPLLLKMFQWNELSMESLIILDNLMGFMNEWDDILDDYIWPDIRTRVDNYRPFLVVDKDKYRQIVQKIVSQND